MHFALLRCCLFPFALALVQQFVVSFRKTRKLIIVPLNVAALFVANAAFLGMDAVQPSVALHALYVALLFAHGTGVRITVNSKCTVDVREELIKIPA